MEFSAPVPRNSGKIVPPADEKKWILCGTITTKNNLNGPDDEDWDDDWDEDDEEGVEFIWHRNLSLIVRILGIKENPGEYAGFYYRFFQQLVVRYKSLYKCISKRTNSGTAAALLGRPGRHKAGNKLHKC